MIYCPPPGWGYLSFVPLENDFYYRKDGKIIAELFEYLPDTWACKHGDNYVSELTYEDALSLVTSWINNDK